MSMKTRKFFAVRLKISKFPEKFNFLKNILTFTSVLEHSLKNYKLLAFLLFILILYIIFKKNCTVLHLPQKTF